MTDEHQTTTIIATVIIESFGDHPDHSIDPGRGEDNCEAHPTALGDAGLQITMVEARFTAMLSQPLPAREWVNSVAG